MIDVKLVDRQFPAFQNQDDRQAGIFGRHLPAAGRQIRALHFPGVKYKLNSLYCKKKWIINIKEAIV